MSEGFLQTQLCISEYPVKNGYNTFKRAHCEPHTRVSNIQKQKRLKISYSYKFIII